MVASLLSVGAWLAWLGFHAPYKTVAGSTSQTGPYEAWQVLGLAVTLILGVFVLAWVGPEVSAAVGGVIGLVLVASCDWATAPNSDGLWIIGVTLLTSLAVAIGGLVVFLAPRLRRPSRG